MVESKVVAVWKLAEKGVELLRKVEEYKEAAEVEACRLAKEKKTMEASKRKAEEEAGQLKQELQELQVAFAVQKEELKAEYQKQVDNMFFYGYRYTLSFPSDDEDEALDGLAWGGGDASKAGLFSGHA
ncbi:hypothetical protein PVL29_018462 [Vitis rotundifolia]|uniref:Uncharacterized protein n=1 Tax=Vitis rotundifolia TaxID=103349 RepID=A0AA38Z5Z0_VITRO|nr:hypothetical protein PVL29_018462 [Vitis rotundifolia]